MTASLHQLTCLTSARFRARAPGPVSGQLCSAPGGRTGHGGAGFLLPFGRRHWLLGASCPARASAPLTIGLPRRPWRRGPERGFHVPHARDAAGIGCSLYPGDDGAYTARHNPQPPPAAFQRPVPVTPAPRPVPGCAINEASARVHWRSPPPGLPLACDPRTDQGPLGFPVSSAPASPGDRHARHGGDRSYGADPGYVFGIKPTSFRRIHS
jgi:hypothetical protein